MKCCHFLLHFFFQVLHFCEALCVCIICEKAAIWSSVSVLNYFVPVYVLLVQQFSSFVEHIPLIYVSGSLVNIHVWSQILHGFSTSFLLPLLLMSSFTSDSGYVTVKEMMRALWLPPATVRAVFTLCTRPACSNGSRARTRDAVSCASMSSSWRQSWSLWGR